MQLNIANVLKGLLMISYFKKKVNSKKIIQKSMFLFSGPISVFMIGMMLTLHQ